MTVLGTEFTAGLRGCRCALRRTDGIVVRLPVRRWHARARGADHWILARCTGPTLDLGCGPGRLVAALGARGLPALGIDISPEAVLRTLTRGGMALHRDALAPLPGEGRWRHVLLADGNIGIGGDPTRLLRRVADLLEPTGTALVELTPAGGLWRGGARLESPESTSPWFPWAQLDLPALTQLAPTAGFTVRSTRRGLRPFAELELTP